MAKAPPIYDLMLLLSTGAPDELRAKILSDVEQAISSGGGTIERNDDWGTRTLAYQIEHQTDAEYHLLQFSGPASLLEALSHSLKIADGVLRFRIIKVLPGTPPAPDPRSAAPATAAPVAASPEPVEAGAEA
jgi:small subunit ribosomal protein S6